MHDTNFQLKIKQQYSVEAIKKKAVELNYNIASVDRLEDGSIKVLARAWG